MIGFVKFGTDEVPVDSLALGDGCIKITFTLPAHKYKRNRGGQTILVLSPGRDVVFRGWHVIEKIKGLGAGDSVAYTYRLDITGKLTDEASAHDWKVALQ